MTVGWWVEFFADVTLTAPAELAFTVGATEVGGGGFTLTAEPGLEFVVEQVSVSADFTLTAEPAMELVAATPADIALTTDPQLVFVAVGHDGWIPGDEDGVTTLPHKVPFTLP